MDNFDEKCPTVICQDIRKIIDTWYPSSISDVIWKFFYIEPYQPLPQIEDDLINETETEDKESMLNSAEQAGSDEEADEEAVNEVDDQSYPRNNSWNDEDEEDEPEEKVESDEDEDEIPDEGYREDEGDEED